MLEKTVNSITFLITGIFFIILGFFACFAGEKLMKTILIVLAIGILINALFRFFLNIVKSHNKFGLFLRTLMDLIFSIFIFIKFESIKNWIIILFGVYLLCHAIFHFINYLIYKQNHVKGRFRILINFFIVLILSLCLITQPNQNIKYAGIIIGIYLIFYGIMSLQDFIFEVLPTKYSNRMKNKIRFPLPIFLTFFIPQQLINLINETLDTKKDTSILYTEKENEPADLFVLIHLARSGTAAFGHVEISFEDKIYSYANYDRHSRRIFDGLGDGVIAVANKEDYINYQIYRQNRYLVEFGLKLSKEQKEAVRKQINHLIHDNTIPYYPDIQLLEMGLMDEKEASLHDMSSELYKLANAKYYKITSGKHKTFYVLKTNCVVVAESILRSIGTFVPENGIIAPGTYYEYLNNEFMKKNSNVISRKIYTKENVENRKKLKEKETK